MSLKIEFEITDIDNKEFIEINAIKANITPSEYVEIIINEWIESKFKNMFGILLKEKNVPYLKQKLNLILNENADLVMP